MNYDLFFKAAEERADRLASILSDLIRIDTSVPPGKNYTKMVEYIEPLLEDAGFKCERVVVPEKRWKKIPLDLEGPRVNLVGKLENGKTPLSIYAHMDVVPAGTGWTVPPFEGIIKDGKVYGRGAVDMKGSIPPVIVALEILKDFGTKPDFDIRFCLCTDEEIGMDPGAAYLAEKGYFVPPILHLEGGGQGPVMIAANSGVLHAVIKVVGREAHSGLSFTGINALEESINVLVELKRLKQTVEMRESSYPALPLPGTPSDNLTPTFNINIIRAGEKINVVPGIAIIEIDRRFLPEEKINDVKREILGAIESARRSTRAVSIDVDFEVLYQNHEIDITSPYVERWCQGVRLALGYPPDMPFLFIGSNGATDMSFVGKILKTRQFVGTGVIDAEHIADHGPDECVPIANMVNLCKELIFFLKR